MIEDIWTRLSKKSGPVVLYGTGNGADKILNELKRLNIEVSGVFASSGFVRDRYFAGLRVMSYEECKEKFPGMTVLMCFGSSRPEVLENVKKIMSECELLIPDVPVYGENIFNAGFYEKNKDGLDFVKKNLADDKSVKTFENIVNFKLTGKPGYLFDCEVNPEEADGIIKLKKRAVIADFGAYNGDTAIKYAGLYADYSKIYAVEPDIRNFNKLCENTKNIKNTVAVNALAADFVGKANIASSKGRGVHEAKTGSEVKCITVDSLLYDGGVDFIKFDVEGNELAALKGGIKTIKKYRPAMLVSCYHRSEDMFTLPLEVLSVCPDYKMFLRHLPGVPAWDTQFYFL